MPESYNLRSLRKKGLSNGNCYLHKFLESKSPEAFNPTVCLERLKLLESHNFENNRFIFKNGQLIVKPKQSFMSNKKSLLKVFCIISLIIMTSLYWKDYFQKYGNIFVNKYSKLLPAVQDHYSDVVHSYKKILSQCFYKDQKVSQAEDKLVFDTTSKKFFSLSDNCAIQQLVEDYLIELKKQEVENNTKQSKVFIEEQCMHDLKDNEESVIENSYNSTFFELTNLVDYALESQGAKIVTVFNSKPYGHLSVNLLGIDLGPKLSHFLINQLKFFSLNGPNSVLIPWRKPGDCWAFQGSQGRILIELSDKIIVTAVTIDHIPKDISPKDSFHSAPKKFSVLGVQDLNNHINETYLGSFEYQSAGPATQTFLIEPVIKTAFKKVEVFFESNHGNKNYTCIYKIRIHGHQ